MMEDAWMRRRVAGTIRRSTVGEDADPTDDCGAQKPGCGGGE
ncbi:MAG TPA: hypothetical protein VN035_15845 [Microbacterium sp.]|nr:hypothetical protein [Microbacterium sp.]